MKRYFVADCNKDGEAISDSIFEINYEQTVAEVREQLQENLRSWVCSQPYGDDAEDACDDLCQIVVDDFKQLEDKTPR